MIHFFTEGIQKKLQLLSQAKFSQHNWTLNTIGIKMDSFKNEIVKAFKGFTLYASTRALS